MFDLTIQDLLISLGVTGGLAFCAFVGWMFAAARKRYRVTCECGHKERTITLSSAKWGATEHMMRCKGKAIVSPLPPREIAKSAEA
jgi:hypothetical protein